MDRFLKSDALVPGRWGRSGSLPCFRARSGVLWRGGLSSVKADNALKFQKRLRHLAFPRRDLAIVVAKLCPKFKSIERRRAGQRESPGTGYIVERSLRGL